MASPKSSEIHASWNVSKWFHSFTPQIRTKCPCSGAAERESARIQEKIPFWSSRAKYNVMSHKPSGLLMCVKCMWQELSIRYSGSRTDFVLLVSLLKAPSVPVPSLSPSLPSRQTLSWPPMPSASIRWIKWRMKSKLMRLYYQLHKRALAVFNCPYYRLKHWYCEAVS